MVFRVEDNNFNVNFCLTKFKEGLYFYKTKFTRFSKTLTVPDEYQDSFILTKKNGDVYTFSSPYVFNEESVIVVEGFEYYPNIFLLNEDEELYYCILTVV